MGEILGFALILRHDYLIKIESDELIIQEMGIPNGISRGSRIALPRGLTDGISNNACLAIERQR